MDGLSSSNLSVLVLLHRDFSRPETLDPDVPELVASYCHAALNSLEDAIDHLVPWKNGRRNGCVAMSLGLKGWREFRCTMFMHVLSFLGLFVACFVY